MAKKDKRHIDREPEERRKTKRIKPSKENKRGRRERGGEKVKYYPRSFLWNILSISLAFLFGIFAALGGLLGVGIVYGTKKPVKDIFGENYLSYVREEYAEASLYDLIAELFGTVRDLATAGGEFTFQSINKITPILENLLTPMSESLSEQGIVLDVDELMNTPVNEFGTYLRTTIVDKTVLAKIVKPDPNNSNDALALALCYGEEDVDFTIVDGDIVMSEGKSPVTLGEFLSDPVTLINKVTVEAALGISSTSNAAMRFLAYGTEGTHYRIGEDGKIEMLVNIITNKRFTKKKLSDLTKDSSNPIEDAQISDLMDINENSSAMLRAIRNWKVSDLKQQARIDRLKISQVINLGNNPSRLMNAIANWRIKDLNDQGKIDSLTLSSLIKIDETSPKLLQKLKNAQLGELSEKTDNLRILDILDETDITSNKILRNLGQSTLKTLSSDIKKLTVRDVYGGDLYSYMKIDEDGNGYKKFAEDYKNEKVMDAIASKDRPEKIPSRATISTCYEVNAVRVFGGWLTPVGEDRYQLLKNADVYRVLKRDEETGQDVTSYYAERELYIFSETELKRVDYDNGGELVFADYGTETRGVDGAVPTVEGIPYCDGEGNQLYYYTEREMYIPEAEALAIALDDEIPVEPDDPEEPTDPSDPTDPEEPEKPEDPKPMEAVYYPLMQDENGVYCIAMTIEGKLVRTDFEESVIGYRTEAGEELALSEKSGMVVYNEADMRIYSHEAVTDEDGVEIVPVRYYLMTKEDAFYAYYDLDDVIEPEETVQLADLDEDNNGDGDEEGPDTPVEPENPEKPVYVSRYYTEASEGFERYWTATWTEAGETGETLYENVKVDRYLSGAWWLIFGNETDDEGNRTEADHTDRPMLEINTEVTNATDTLKELLLWELYFHGFIDENPYCELPGDAGNLNMMTLDGVIKYLKGLQTP